MRAITSLAEFQRLLKHHDLSVYVALRGGLRSSHTFSLDHARIVDYSMVDGSVSRYILGQFRKSFYAEAMAARALYLESKLKRPG